MKKLGLLIFTVITLLSCSPGVQKKVSQGTEYKNKKIPWGIKKIEGSAPQIPDEWAKLLERFDGFYAGDQSERSLFLTFDEGYENGYTAKILDVLKEKNVTAAFFITGAYITKEPGLVKRMAQEGHIVGNHTYNHPSMPEILKDEKLKKELDDLNEKFFSLTGKKMNYLRPPKGEFSERTLALSQKHGYKTILWSNAYVDWILHKNSNELAFNSITKYLHNGCIILMHAVSKENASVLDKVIDFARQQGYTFKSLDDL